MGKTKINTRRQLARKNNRDFIKRLNNAKSAVALVYDFDKNAIKVHAINDEDLKLFALFFYSNKAAFKEVQEQMASFDKSQKVKTKGKLKKWLQKCLEFFTIRKRRG